MNMWEAIVLIVIVSGIASVLRTRYHARHGIVEDNAGNQQPIVRGPDPEVQREVEELRKRIAVLERIATDDRKSHAIAAEIESLRDS